MPKARTEESKGKKRRTMPDPIPDSLKSVAKAVLNTKPKKRSKWKFVQDHEGVGSGSSSQATRGDMI